MMKKTKRSLQWIKKNEKQKCLGLHLTADFWNGKVIEDPKKIKRILIEAVKKANNNPLEVVVHKFHPQGVTGIILLAESHLAIHTWPEFSYVAVDIYTCGDRANPFKALAYLKEEFQPKKVKVKEIKRGKK